MEDRPSALASSGPGGQRAEPPPGWFGVGKSPESIELIISLQQLHPVRQLPFLIHALGPLIGPVHRAAMRGERIVSTRLLYFEFRCQCRSRFCTADLRWPPSPPLRGASRPCRSPLTTPCRHGWATCLSWTCRISLTGHG